MDRGDAPAKVCDLHFYVFERSVHPELFNILRRRDIEAEAYRAQIFITGQSHLISFRTAGRTLTQVLAPGDAPLPRGGVREGFPILDSATEKVSMDGTIQYEAEIAIERLGVHEYARRHRDLIATNGLDRIKYFFPEGAGSTLSPFALMEFHPQGHRIETVAVHAYPGERTLIIARSRFGVVPGESKSEDRAA